jgi:hypothetical protein
MNEDEPVIEEESEDEVPSTKDTYRVASVASYWDLSPEEKREFVTNLLRSFSPGPKPPEAGERPVPARV